jgi:hypothetical protein
MLSQILNQFKKYLNALYETARTDWNILLDRQTKEITKAIKDKEYETINPTEISEPIVEKLDEVSQAVKDIEFPDFPEIPKTDFSELSAKIEELKETLEKKDLSVNIGKTKVNIDTTSIVKALGKIEKKLDKLEQKEITDYTLMLDELMKILEKPFDFTEIKKIKESVDALATKLATTEDISVIADWLKSIYEKKEKEYGFEFENGRLKVAVDRVGGGGGGLTPIETGYLQKLEGVATEETLQASLADYKITDFDNEYYGYTKANGEWYIMKITDTSARYAKGDTDYETNWAERASLSYGLFFNVF